MEFWLVANASIVLPFPYRAVRCGEHSDYGTVTFLYQDDVGGLEVKTVDGRWTEAAPLKGAILMNVGDLLDVFSGGLFPATLHRVVVPKAEFKRKTSRQSIVFFLHPDGETCVEDKVNAAKPSVIARDHVMNRFKQTYG